MMGLWQSLRKSWIIRGYLRDCPEHFLRRYGFEEQYSTARVLATLSTAGLSGEFSEYACALFAGEEEFIAWALNEHRIQLAVPSWIRAQARSGEQARAPFPAGTPSSRPEAQRLYHRLRDEVAERYNQGRRVFMPRPSASLGEVNPLRSSIESSRGFGWYR